MRYKFSATLILAMIIFSCKPGSEHSVNHHDSKTTISINNGFNNLKIEYAGDISFNDDETAIQNISEDGYVRFKSGRKKMYAESDGHGGVRYELHVGLNPVGMDEKGREMIAEAVKMMLENGVDAKKRVSKLYAKGGITAVLNKVRAIESSYLKNIYLDYLLSNGSLSANEKILVSQHIAGLENSDYEKSKLLEKYANSFTEPDVRQAFFVAVKSIDSDYEKSQVLKSLIKDPVANESATAILSVTETVESDYEKSVVLKELLQSPIVINSESREALVKTISGINSAYEKSEVLKMMLSHRELDAAVYGSIIHLVTKIDGNYEKAQLFQLVAEKPITDNNTWITLINAVAGIDANYEKSQVLIAIAGRMPATPEVKDAYLAAAKTIDGEYEYGQVVKAIR